MFFFELLTFLFIIGIFVELLLEMPRKPEWMQFPGGVFVMKLFRGVLFLCIGVTSLIMLKFISDHLFYSPGRIIPRIFYPQDAYTPDTYEASDFVIGSDVPDIEERTKKRFHGDYVDRLIDDLNRGEGNVPVGVASKLVQYSSEPKVMQALLLTTHSTYTAYRESAKAVLYGKNDPITVLDRIKPTAPAGTDPELLYFLGKTYLEKGDGAAGAPLIRQALDLERSQNAHIAPASWAREGTSLLALAYAEGAPGVPRNSEEALKWFTRFAEHDYRTGGFVLGAIYAEGKYGIKPNRDEAVRWLERAASDRNDKAPDYLARFLYAQKDYKRALPWVEKRAQKGDKEYQYRLGLLYLNGLGVKRDYGKAEEVLRQALPHEKAPEQLLKIYRSGHGREKNAARTIKDLEYLIRINRILPPVKQADTSE
jgi:TPR repeat protein